MNPEIGGAVEYFDGQSEYFAVVIAIREPGVDYPPSVDLQLYETHGLGPLIPLRKVEAAPYSDDSLAGTWRWPRQG